LGDRVPLFNEYVTRYGAGVALDDATDDVLLPVVFVATAVNVYACPLVRPVNVQVVAGDVIVQVNDPGDDVTV
jgi:hypothetical protein